MIKKMILIMTAVCLAVGLSLGDVWQDLSKYKYGEGNTVDETEKLLTETPVAQHAAIEDSLIAVVSSKDATEDGKACACRMLQQIGTEKCIPAVAALLTDEVLSHYARLVLQRMGNPKADEAMRAALDSAPDNVKIGIMGSLAERRDDTAVKQVAKFMACTNPAVASAAMSALGKMGGPSSAGFLCKLKPPENLQRVYMTALLDCASSLKTSDAVALYDIVLAGKTTHRIAALNGMLAVDEKKAVELMVNAIKGDDVQLGKGVLTLVAGEKSERLTKAMASLLGKLPDEKKIDLITTLGARRDKAAVGSITGCMTSTNELVRTSAVTALSKIGDEATVNLLLGWKGGSSDAIAKMSGAGINDALIKALEDNKLKVPAIRALVARNCIDQVSTLFGLVNDRDVEVRIAAWVGLGSLATDDDIARIAKAAFSIKNEVDLSCAVTALRNICAHAMDRTKCFDVVIPYYDGATVASKATIIELASLVGSPSALELVKKSLKSGNQELVGKAVRSLAAWCRENAADELLVLAGSAPEEVERILALRGYIRLAGEGPNLNEEQRAEMFKKAAVLAKRVDERKLIAGNLNKAPHAITLALANTYLDDPAVREDAEPSAIDIAENLCAQKKGSADVLKEVGNKLLSSKNGGVVARGKRLLDEMK